MDLSCSICERLTTIVSGFGYVCSTDTVCYLPARKDSHLCEPPYIVPCSMSMVLPSTNTWPPSTHLSRPVRCRESKISRYAANQTGCRSCKAAKATCRYSFVLSAQ
jgi:hypothetical protein